MSHSKPKIGKPIVSTFYDHSAHQNVLIDGFNSMRQKGELLDITFIIEGSTFRAHKAVLAACSDYFRAMFTDNMLEASQTEICLNGVSAKGFNELLEYVYTARLALSVANIQDVLAAASHVQIVNCIMACSNYLQSQIDLENCIDIAAIAETYSLKSLQVKVYRFMSGHLLEFSNSAEFYRLCPLQLENLLAYDFPVNCAESDVLRIVLSWFFHVDNHESDGRIDYAIRIIKYIHFKEISKRKLDSILDKFFQDRKYQWQIIRKIIIQEMLLQTSDCLIPFPRMFSTLLNWRGMEQAILKIGGFELSGVTNEITYRFAGQRKWMNLTTIPHVEQCNYGTAVYNNELYIVGGCFNQVLQEIIHPFGFKYNPRFDKWTHISPMTIERCRFSLNVVGGLLYTVGGISECDQFDTRICESYNPVEDTWSIVAELPAHITQHAGAGMENSSGNKLYISGGIDRDRDHVCLATVYCYDTALKRWTTCAPLLKPRADHVMLSTNELLFVCGGWTSDDPNRELVDTIEVYNAAEDTWEVLTKVPTPRYHAGITLMDNKIYFIGGFQTDSMIDKDTVHIEYYNIDNNRWTVENKYPRDVWEHTCITLCIPKCRDDTEILEVLPELREYC